MPACPSCHADYPTDDVNVSEGVAYCRDCDLLTRLSDLLPSGSPAAPPDSVLDSIDTESPPDGCFVMDLGSRIRIVASARSFTGAAGALFTALFWNGIVSVFVAIAIGGTLQRFGIPLPSWAPSGMNGMPVLFLWVFLLPFIAIGVVLFWAALTSLLGRCEATLSGPDAVLFTGFGPIGWKRRFQAVDIRSVRLGQTTWTQNKRHRPCIEVQTSSGKTHRLGTILPEPRRKWMAAALKELLVTPIPNS